MKAALSVVIAAALLGPARAQTTPKVVTTGPAPAQAKAIRRQTADRRAASYQGPRVVKDGKKLGREMLKDSKPAPTTPAPVAPVRQ